MNNQFMNVYLQRTTWSADKYIPLVLYNHSFCQTCKLFSFYFDKLITNKLH
jgi:hypothetical protein